MPRDRLQQSPPPAPDPVTARRCGPASSFLLSQQPDAIPAADAPPIVPPSWYPHEGLNETETR